MLYNLRFFSLQNAVYFIMLPCLVSVLLTFQIQDVLKLKKKSVAKRLKWRLLRFRGSNVEKTARAPVDGIRGQNTSVFLKSAQWPHYRLHFTKQISPLLFLLFMKLAFYRFWDLYHIGFSEKYFTLSVKTWREVPCIPAPAKYAVPTSIHCERWSSLLNNWYCRKVIRTGQQLYRHPEPLGNNDPTWCPLVAVLITKHRLKCLKRFKGRLVGLFQHCIRRLIVLLPPNEFLHSSPEAPRTIQARETSGSEGRNYYQGKLGCGTDSFTSPPKEGVLRIIRTPEKSNGFGYQRPACWPLDHRSRYAVGVNTV